jgi:hypothetical protein
VRSGTAITLKYQHDHIEDSVLVFSSQECSVLLLVSADEEIKSFVKLDFDKAMCTRSARTDCSPAIGIYPKEAGVSFIVELTESTWPIEAHKSYVYADSNLKPRGRHFVVSNHDVFHEILADSFTETLVENGDDMYQEICRHFV